MLTGRLLGTYGSVAEAAALTGRSPSSVSGMAQTRGWPSTSFELFRYAEDVAPGSPRRITCSVKPIGAFRNGRLFAVYRTAALAAVDLAMNVKTVESHAASGEPFHGVVLRKLARIGEWNLRLLRDRPAVYEGTAGSVSLRRLRGR